MKFKTVVLIVFMSVLALAVSTRANAQISGKKTFVTFSGPVEIPGVGAQVLPAGKYVFRIVDNLGTRDIVQIWNEDETHVYATIITIPNYRLKATGETVITFKERAAGAPQALRAWFYPGNIDGQEFVYPKARALEIAKAAQEPVLAMPSELAREITAPVTTKEGPSVKALEQAPVKAVEPSGQEVEIAEVIPPKALPKTASLLPVLGLVGLLSLGIGFALSLKQAA
jgi:hypothetical protein